MQRKTQEHTYSGQTRRRRICTTCRINNHTPVKFPPDSYPEKVTHLRTGLSQLHGYHWSHVAQAETDHTQSDTHTRRGRNAKTRGLASSQCGLWTVSHRLASLSERISSQSSIVPHLCYDDEPACTHRLFSSIVARSSPGPFPSPSATVRREPLPAAPVVSTPGGGCTPSAPM